MPEYCEAFPARADLRLMMEEEATCATSSERVNIIVPVGVLNKLEI